MKGLLKQLYTFLVREMRSSYDLLSPGLFADGVLTLRLRVLYKSTCALQRCQFCERGEEAKAKVSGLAGIEPREKFKDLNKDFQIISFVLFGQKINMFSSHGIVVGGKIDSRL